MQTHNQIEGALRILRQTFINMNPELVTKIEGYKKTGSFSGSIGGKDSHHFDFKDFLGVLEGGFASPNIRELFECMTHLYYFKGCIELGVDIYPHIHGTTFNEEAFLKDSREVASVVTSLKVVEETAIGILDRLGIKDRAFLTKDHKSYEELRDILRVIREAKKSDLNHSGDRQFIISKIRINDKPFVMTNDISLKDGIIYTNNPEQIVSMAAAAKPGIYLVANVPYGKAVNAAFYFIFVNNSDAILVENNKHSFRNQIYRTKSNGQNGKEAWLERRYEGTYLPLVDVLEFFEKESDSKELKSINSSFSFKVIKKLSDCHPVCILWTQAFIDSCIHQFNTTGVLQEASPALAIEFLKGQEALDAPTTNLPAAYRNGVPTLAELDVSWDPKKLDLRKEESSGDYLLGELVEVPVTELMEVPQTFGLTSQKQIQASLAYQKRQLEATELEYQIQKDFIKNALSVRKSLIRHVCHRYQWVIERALEDRGYPGKFYRHFGGNPKKIPSGATSHILDVSVLFTEHEGREHHFLSRDGNYSISGVYYNDDPSKFRIEGTDFTRHEEVTCSYCRNHKQKFRYILCFQDYLQYKTFFEVTPEEEKKLPRQLSLHLNQNRTLYVGNTILNDIDPMSQIRNPWWSSSLDRWDARKICWGNDRNPHLSISFGLCGICRNKIKRKQG